MHINSLRIVDFSPLSESGVARRLAHDAESWSLSGSLKIETSLTRITNRMEFEHFVLRVLESCLRLGEIPVLHFEAHGSREGIVIGSDELIPWQDFFAMLRVINIAIKNNLLITLAACESAWSLLEVDLAKEAPVCAVIAPVHAVTLEEVEVGFQNFYRELICNADVYECLKALNKALQSEENEFVFLDAETMFNDAADEYVNEHCRGGKRRERLKRLVDRAVEAKLTATISLTAIRKEVRRQLWTDAKPAMKKAFDKFLMIDRYPENLTRFSFNVQDRYDNSGRRLS